MHTPGYFYIHDDIMKLTDFLKGFKNDTKFIFNYWFYNSWTLEEEPDVLDEEYSFDGTIKEFLEVHCMEHQFLLDIDVYLGGFSLNYDVLVFDYYVSED